MTARRKIGLAQIKALKPGETIWDSRVIGFGARRQKGAAVAYVLIYRTREGRQRFATIGRHGAPWTPDTARDEAKRMLGDVVNGGDPAADKIACRKAQTVAELCDSYLEDAENGRLLTRRGRPKKDSTLAIDRGRIERHIKPLVGKLKVAAVTRHDIDKLLHDVAQGKTATTIKTKPRGVARVTGGEGTANRVVRLLGGVFSYAVAKGLRSDNPCKGVVQFEDGQRDRRLNDNEYSWFGTGLTLAKQKDMWPSAVAAVRFLALTGWRSGEVIALRWNEVDLARRTATLGDTKTGRSMRPISQAACEVLAKLARSGERSLVFGASRGDSHTLMTGFKRYFRKIVKHGELPSEITPHTMRHSFASVAADLGYSDLTIAALVGHKGRSTTSRYTHAADAVLLGAADAVADRITLHLDGNAAAVVIALPARRA